MKFKVRFHWKRCDLILYKEMEGETQCYIACAIRKRHGLDLESSWSSSSPTNNISAYESKILSIEIVEFKE